MEQPGSCIHDMLHEDPVLVLKQNNTPMMTLNMFIFERTSSSSWKEQESLRGQQQQQKHLGQVVWDLMVCTLTWLEA